MNPGLTDEAGQTARGLIDALKAQPAVLALTVANIGMVVFLFYALHGAAQFRDNMITQSVNLQREMAQLLSKCIVPDSK